MRAAAKAGRHGRVYFCLTKYIIYLVGNSFLCKLNIRPAVSAQFYAGKYPSCTRLQSQ